MVHGHAGEVTVRCVMMDALPPTFSCILMSAFMWPVYVDSLSLRMCANYIIARLWLGRIIWRTRSRESSNGLCLGLPPVHISLDKKLNASYPGGIRRPWLNVCAACACMSVCNLCVCVEEESTTVNTFLIRSGFNINGNHIMTRLQKKNYQNPSLSFQSCCNNLQQRPTGLLKVVMECYHRYIWTACAGKEVQYLMIRNGRRGREIVTALDTAKRI